MSPASYLTAPPRGGSLKLAGRERAANLAAKRENPSVHADSEAYTVEPIGVVRSPRTEPIDDDWGEVVSAIEPERTRRGVCEGIDLGRSGRARRPWRGGLGGRVGQRVTIVAVRLRGANLLGPPRGGAVR